MSRILPVSNPKGDVATTLSAIKSKLGMVPNLYATVGHSSTVLNAYLTFSDALSKGRLSTKQRELIALAIAQINQCQYCLSAHTLIAGSTGLGEKNIKEAREGKADNALDQALIILAIDLVEQRGELTTEQLDTAAQNGVDSELIFEVLALVTANIFTNYANHLAQTDIDFPEVSLTV
ncbi:carboxymuconolactone decarboxylase family protein [Shewanella schlegeliana]|uniref:Carboxymuconolactone decarboxylase family protein n=1 Tax=Shewanella schlegeliana TaxID=190308 RepID=A0ABS1SZZ8_9GAMM|nr:carboxymuconolactone decarboxylase family protein [Shewanella schlegeliana]MBL4914112.1 carboxymuconolactone decarboxylase family protein [Shewanella schlegeliana]MCL1110851.1 carboxymuconolactone decarboxylase family protein [Shewanella schlegeliana]GIU36259.1 alkyl hydroperoxide reductase AhpD [Shewanella schlegeliana]